MSASAGLLAEYEEPAALLEAARGAYASGYRRLDACTPFPVEGLAEALGGAPDVMAAIVLAGGLAGGVGGYALQYYASVVSYPLIVAGRPFNSWPAFVPVTFELAVLGAALAAVFGLLIVCSLPQPYHPFFHVPRFEFATRDRFFLFIASEDERFDEAEVRAFLESTRPLGIYAVPR